jgi:allantoin racemase
MRIANILPQAVEDLHLHPNEEFESDGVQIESVFVKTFLPAVTSRLRMLETDVIYIEAALRAERDGFDAIVVNSINDYGIDVMRDALGIPVTGAGESGIRAALENAPSFSIVTVWPSVLEPYYQKVMDDNGFADRVRSIRYALEEDGEGQLAHNTVFAGVEDTSSSVAERVLRSARSAIERDGAESIVIGCTCMTGLVEFLGEQLSVPVVNPLREAYDRAAAQVRARADVQAPPRVGVSADDEFAVRIQLAVDSWAAIEDIGEVSLECGNACQLIAS